MGLEHGTGLLNWNVDSNINIANRVKPNANMGYTLIMKISIIYTMRAKPE